MFRSHGLGRAPCRPRRRRRRPKGSTEFDECMAFFRRLVLYDAQTGTVHDDDDEEEVPDQEEKGDEILKVRSVDLDVKNNAVAHHTNEYDITDASVYGERENLVVRRGQQFNMIVNFNRAYNAKEDDLLLVFDFGKMPLPSKGTRAQFILSDEDLPNQWGAFIKSGKNENSLIITVTTPPTCPVGKWSLKIDVVKKTNKGKNVYRYVHSDHIYILFNPWCKDDQVYMEHEQLLEEYVLNESGEIYRGNCRRISPCAWEFGQFSEDVLDCVMYLLDKSELSGRARGDPVQVARKISGLVNCCDNNGVLHGNWSGNYEGGVSPLAWTGSVAILEQYFKTKEPVKYGQCWVFSGVTTTVCRALGIPARSVTNFASAHDTDGSVTIDKHFDVNGEEIEDLNGDSVWNFHVWNDVWMSRPDLPAGDYGGWQAIDATPQETSGGVFCMGPMPLKAIKNGEIHLPYDGPFAFAEVNADRVYWVLEEDGNMRITRKVKNSVGQYISTKRPFGRQSWRDFRRSFCPRREDITDQYKYPEGSIEERAAVRRANQYSTKDDVYQTELEDVTFELTCDEETFIGDAINVSLKMKNTTDSARNVTGAIKVSSIFYTGVICKEVLRHPFKKGSIVLQGQEEKSVSLEIPVEEYIDKLTDHCHFKVACMCTVDETKQIFTCIDDTRLRKPHLNIKAPDACCIGKKFEAEVSFENPLPVTLTRCELRVEGPGLQRPAIFSLQNVNAKQTFTNKFDMLPVKPGQKEIIVSFNSAQLSAINVSVPVDVTA